MDGKGKPEAHKICVNVPFSLWEKIEKEHQETKQEYKSIIIDAINIKYKQKEELMGELDDLLSRSLKGERTILDEWFEFKFNQRVKKVKVDISTESP